LQRLDSPRIIQVGINTSEPSGLIISGKLAMPPGPSQSIAVPLQRADRADRISDAAWEEHRETIIGFYIEQGMRLEDLVRRMDEDFGFKARQAIQVVYQHHGISIDLPHGDE
jgi:hypothetical protein